MSLFVIADLHLSSDGSKSMEVFGPVWKDYMEKMDVKYPNYGFKKHKGYPTKDHLEALEKYGPCKIHRKTYAPVSKYFSKQLALDLTENDKK